MDSVGKVLKLGDAVEILGRVTMIQRTSTSAGEDTRITVKVLGPSPDDTDTFLILNGQQVVITDLNPARQES